MKTRASSFGFRIFRLNLVMVFLVGLVLSTLFVREQNDQAERSLDRRGATLARSLAAASEIGAYGGGSAALEPALRGALADGDVQYAVVYDATGNVISSLTPDSSLQPPAGSEHLDTDARSAIDAAGVSFEDASKPPHIEPVALYRAPSEGYPTAGVDSYFPILITRQDGGDDAALLGAEPGKARRERIGFARVGMSREGVALSRSRSGTIALITLAIALVAAAIASLELSRRLAAPIRHLAEGAQALGAGKLSERVRVETLDEVGELAQAFNRMAANLQDVYQGLEVKVAERTAEVSDEKHRLEAVLNTVDEGVVMLDARGRFVLVNRKFLEIANVPRERVQGKTFHEVTELFESRITDMKSLRERTHFLLRHPHERAVDMFEITAPERRVMHRFSAPVYDDGIDGLGALMGRIEVYRDITRETEIDRMKSEFISTVSHELRTPLTSIKGSLGLILGGAAGPLPPDANDLLMIAQNNSERLIRLINDILDISKIESGKMKLKLSEFDLKDVIHETVQGIDAFAQRHEVTMRVETGDMPMPISADRDRILQILTNLLSNAIKFSRTKGEVRLAVERKDGQYVFKVVDAGIGIPADQIGKLFQKFQQVDGTFANQVGGSGLGLAICRALVQEHGGDIGVTSEHGVGSTFEFTLPAPETTAGEAVMAALAATGAVEGTPRILVVDDDRDVATLIRMYLEQEGFECVTANGGRAALEIARREHFDAITLDLNMPDVSGFDVARALKEDPATKDTPVIFVSVNNAEEVTPPGTAAASLSFADWITKPIDPTRLVSAVKRHAHRRSGKPTILVVDDDPDIQKLLGILLSREGFEVESAGNGEEALRRVAARKPDLLILDLVMPTMDGFQVVKRLREQKSTRRIPVLVLSVKDLSDEERIILQTGATKFLTKSYASREALLREVVEMLNGAIRAGTIDAPTATSRTISTDVAIAAERALAAERDAKQKEKG